MRARQAGFRGGDGHVAEDGVSENLNGSTILRRWEYHGHECSGCEARCNFVAASEKIHVCSFSPTRLARRAPREGDVGQPSRTQDVNAASHLIRAKHGCGGGASGRRRKINFGAAATAC